LRYVSVAISVSPVVATGGEIVLMVPVPTWAHIAEYPLTRESFNALLHNRIPAIRIAGFASLKECESFSAAVKAGPMKYYSVARRIGYIGMAQYEYRWNTPKERYFDNVPEAQATLDAVIAQAGWNPVERLMECVAAVTGGSIGRAEEESLGSYFAGIVRSASEGVALHVDYAPFNSPAYSISQIDAQLGWNFFSEGLSSGGHTTLYNAPWSPEIVKGEIPKSYDLPRDLIAGAPSFTYAPTPGDVVIFNTRNPHEIAGGEAQPNRDRISIGSFIGRMPDGRLTMWS
jgi:hypothetical protein